MTKKYTIIVTIFGILLTAFCTYLGNSLLDSKRALRDAEENSRVLVTSNTSYIDQLGRTHTETVQAKIQIEWLKDSKDSLQRELYRAYMAETKSKKKNMSAMSGVAYRTQERIAIPNPPKPSEDGLIVRQFTTPYLDAMVVIGEDSTTLDYTVSDTAIVGISDYKIGKWRLINIFKKRTIGHKVNVSTTNPNTKILDVRYYDLEN